MRIVQTQFRCLSLCAVIVVSLTGCLAIDYSPIDQQPFYHRTDYASPAYEAFMSFNGPYMEDYLTYILKTMIDGFNPSGNTAGR